MLDYLITAALGVIVALMGFGKIAVSKNAEKNREYLDRYGRLLRIGGIVLVLIGAILAIMNLAGR